MLPVVVNPLTDSKRAFTGDIPTMIYGMAPTKNIISHVIATIISPFTVLRFLEGANTRYMNTPVVINGIAG